MELAPRFDQHGYATYRKLEHLLLNACQGRQYRDQLQYLCDLYQELDASLLDVQLQSLQGQFAQSDECIAFLQELSPPARTYYSEVVKVVQLILVMPATNAVSERQFSTMSRIKSYLRSTMRQDHLNHLMTLHIYQDKPDNLDLISVANEFVSLEHRCRFFGTFTQP